MDDLNSYLFQPTRIPENFNEKELFRLSFENANIGMCMVDLKGNLVKVNTEMSNIFGYSTAELERMNVNEIAHPDFNCVSPCSLRMPQMQ
jgi:PAS domain-containing protein